MSPGRSESHSATCDRRVQGRKTAFIKQKSRVFVWLQGSQRRKETAALCSETAQVAQSCSPFSAAKVFLVIPKLLLSFFFPFLHFFFFPLVFGQQTAAGHFGKNIHKSWFNYSLTHFHAIHPPSCLLKSSTNLLSFDCQKSFGRFSFSSTHFALHK